ncbi:PF11689 family protein [Leptospira interrogans serovar Pyrogenes str. 2006006960]|nr:PF11689 family protein [Leptospira interrogans serovar Pyrogenes str. 2006006960]
MDRRSGLKKAHFLSVPTNESFYLQKVCFSDREKFSEPYHHPKIEKTQHNALYESRCGAGTKFYRRFCRNSDRFILRSNTCGVGDEFVETTAFY